MTKPLVSVAVLEGQNDDDRHRRFFDLPRNRKLARMISGRLHHARRIVRESARTGVGLANACALMELESTGRNVFGCDHGFHSGPPWCHQDVTKDRVLALERVSWPQGVTNGVGPGQLTSTSFVRAADALGGSWRVKYNLRVSFRILHDLQRRLGPQTGANAYNGDPTGNYGRRFIAARNIWQDRINATLS